MLKILIADDEKYIRQGIEAIINREFPKEFNILFAKNGNEVIEIIEKNDIDILITDIRMPHKDGLETIKYVHGKRKMPVTIVISGYGEFEYARKCIQFGVKEYLLKPIEREKLANTIRKIKSTFSVEEIASLEEVKKSPEDFKDKEIEYIESAIKYIDENYKKDINMAVVSNFISINYSYFSKLFNKYIKLSFADYLNYIRVSKAKKLLKTSDLKVYEIAESVGYSDSKYFLRIFKRLENTTPQKYRNENR